MWASCPKVLPPHELREVDQLVARKSMIQHCSRYKQGQSQSERTGKVVTWRTAYILPGHESFDNFKPAQGGSAHSVSGEPARCMYVA